MTPPPLCIIQARYHSTRLPGKMLLKLGEETLIARAWRLANEAFEHVVVAIPKSDEDGPLGDELRRINAHVFAFDGPEWDVLSRFWACAHTYRWNQDTIIHRWTPDDPFKDPSTARLVVQGFRAPVELGGEAFALSQLTRAQHVTPKDHEDLREHIGRHAVLAPVDPPKCPEGVWTIDTKEDYDAAVTWHAGLNDGFAFMKRFGT